MASEVIHAGLAARRVGGVWSGALLCGPSGGGKSDLLLRLLGRGWVLVADDRVIVWRSESHLFGRAPETLLSLLEVRGVGVLRMQALSFARVEVVVGCRTSGPAVERMPQASTAAFCGVFLPRLELDCREASAPDKLEAFCGHERL